jgi:hypothetical protein
MEKEAKRKLLEMFVKKYDLGKKRNWEAVFGPKIYSWFLPITSAPMISDGIIWMKKENLFQSDLIANKEFNAL